MNRLPAQFSDLEHFVDYWDIPTSQDRWNKRAETFYNEIKEFYDAMVPRIEEATLYVEQYSLADMPDQAASLFRLILALMHASVAVELHKAARVPYSPYPHSLRLKKTVQPFG